MRISLSAITDSIMEKGGRKGEFEKISNNKRMRRRGHRNRNLCNLFPPPGVIMEKEDVKANKA